MFRTQRHSAWLALNLALCIATMAALTVGTFWIIGDGEMEREKQAQQFQRAASQALELSRGNPRSLQTLLSSLPGAPMFSALEIHGKSGRLLEVRYDAPDLGWLAAIPAATPAALEKSLDAKNALTLRLFPAPTFLIHRLASSGPMMLVMTAFAFLIVNLAAWLFGKHLGFGFVEEIRWNRTLDTDLPKPGRAALVDAAPDPLLDCLPDAVLRCDTSGRISYLNATARVLLKPLGEQTEQANVLDMIAPWDRNRVAELLAKAYPPGSHERLETQAAGTRRGILPVTMSIMAAPDRGDERVLAIHDASASRSQLDMLQVRNLLLDTLPDGFAVLSPQDNSEMLYCNHAFLSLLSLGDESTRNDAWLDRIASQVAAPVAEQIRLAMGQMSDTAIDLPWRAEGGNARMLQLCFFPAHGVESRLVCTLRDRSEEALYHHHVERDSLVRRRILDEMPLGLCITDDNGQIRIVNAYFAKLTAKDPQQLIGTPFSDWVSVHPAIQGLSYLGEQTIRAVPQGRIVKVNALPLPGPDGDNQTAYFFEDVTAFKQQAQADGVELDRLQRTLDGIADVIITTNENGFIQYINPYGQKLTGLAEHQCKGMPFGQVVQLIDEKKREPLVDPAIRAIRIGKAVKFRQDVLFIKENRQELAVEISATPMCDRKNTVIGAVIVMKDVAEQRSLSQQMQQRASRDPLTGLINRRELLSLLEGLQYEVEEQSRQHTLCYMDLDKFKVVNDSCGHNAGDELLRQVSHLMNECLRASDVLARIGGDEFCAVLCNTSAENGNIVAEKIREAVKRFRFTWDDKFFEIGVSIGLFGLQVGLSVEDTISAADQACYQAKEAGRDQVFVATTATRGSDKPALTPWSERLSEALDHDYFRLLRLDMQALSEQPAESAAYHEVLLQLHEPNQPPLVASAFMPNAHRLNLGPSIERWVIGKLFSTIATSAMNDASRDIYAIRLSPATMTEGSFMPFLSEQSKRHGILARHICFEIAEDDLVQNFSVVQRFMLEGKKDGYGFCLSRFGGGVSSFAYLRNLPLDFLKIDSSLTLRIETDAVDTVIVRAIQAISRQLNIRTIASHAQDQNLLTMLGSLGIDYVQGPLSEAYPLEPTARGQKP